METGYSDRFATLRTTNKTIDGMQRSREFMTMTNSQEQSGKDRKTGSGNPTAEPEEDYEETSRQRGKTRISTSTKLPGTNRVTPLLVTSLVDNGATMEEALTRIMDSMGEQSEQMSKRMSELERAVHVERESLREEINHNRQEVSRSEKRLKERTDEYLAKNLSRMIREAEERERPLRGDLEQIRSQQEHALGTLDTRIDTMMERRTQAIMDRLDGLVGNRSNSRTEEHTRERLTGSRE